jgi:hypothetical protein
MLNLYAFRSVCLVTHLAALLAGFAVAAFAASAPTSDRARQIGYQRAVVFDERLSALRTQPDVKARLLYRLRRGRVVWIIKAARNRADGARFFRVTVTRRTRGWILAEALLRRGHLKDAERAIKLIEETRDNFARVQLARLCADESRNAAVAPRALLLLGQAAEAAAAHLSREAKRRIGTPESNGELSRRQLWLNYHGLDRYNRLGITFDYAAASDQLVYDGGAYRELLRKYPRCAEADEARERLQSLGKL